MSQIEQIIKYNQKLSKIDDDQPQEHPRLVQKTLFFTEKRHTYVD